MGFFSKLFGGSEKAEKRAITPEELVRSSVEDGVLYELEPTGSLSWYAEVFFFEMTDDKIGLRDIGTDGRKKTLTLEKLSQYEIKPAGAVQKAEDKEKILNEISNRETDQFYSFYFLNEKGLEQDWPDGYLVKDDSECLVVKKSQKAKKEYSVRKSLIYDIIFHEKDELE